MRGCAWALEHAFVSIVAFATIGCEAASSVPPVVLRASSASSRSGPPASPVSAPTKASLDDPRAFSFVLREGRAAYVVTPMRPAEEERARTFATTPLRAVLSTGGHDPIVAIEATAARLPERLRLGGVRVQLYRGDALFCEGRLGAAALAKIGSGEPDRFFELGKKTLVLHAIEVDAGCRDRLFDERGVAWARASALPPATLVGRTASIDAPEVASEVARAMAVVRGRPSVQSAQASLDRARRAVSLAPVPLESSESGVTATFTRLRLRGEELRFLAFGNACPPPEVHVGIELHVSAGGALEVSKERESDVIPSAIVDVDGDGELEAIETEGSLALRSFERGTTYQSVTVEHCF